MTEEQKNQQDELDLKIKENLARIKHKILVLSNKGGVGKSFTSVSLSASLSKDSKVGLLDADIHGPSIAKMLGFDAQKAMVSPHGIIPARITPNLSAFSMASLISSPDMPVIWRGPMKMGALKQFIGEVLWGNLDYLVVDAPPGTGDEPLSICQLIPDMDGAIIVTTPQEVALTDSRKCVQFLRQLKIHILGIIENMSGFTCPHCGKNVDIFKTGGGEKAARELGIPFLGRIPVDPNIVEAGDKGVPFTELFAESPTAKKFAEIVEKIRNKLEQR